MQLFVAGILPTLPTNNGSGVVGAPVVKGGVALRSGDIVVGETDRVEALPIERAGQVVEAPVIGA